MSLSLVDRSNYYRGLLVITRKDGMIDSREREVMLQLGGILDFDRRFCEAAIDDLLRNPHISDEPVTFSEREIAECFLLDGIRFALVERIIDPKVLAWLNAVARANGVSLEWLDAEVRRLREAGDSADLPESPAIRRFLP